MDLTDAQREVVAHRGGPCVVTAGLGCGATTALAARAERLRRDGRRVAAIDCRHAVPFASAILRRQGRDARVISRSEQHAIVDELLSAEGATAWPVLGEEIRDPALRQEIADTVVAYQASFLGREELMVHTDAAGVVEVWAELAAFTDRYLAALADHRVVDEAGALVGASLLLRDPEVRAAERARFDELLVDDFQVATFAIARLVAQLTGPGADVTIAGHPDGALGAGGGHLRSAARRWGAAGVVELTESTRHPTVPELRILESVEEEAGLAATVARAAEAQGLSRDDVGVLRRLPLAGVDTLGIDDAIGREWPVVLLLGATDGTLPAARPTPLVFDTDLLGGPDLPDPAVRDERWRADERRRFRIACSRATRWLVVAAPLSVTPFVTDLVR